MGINKNPENRAEVLKQKVTKLTNSFCLFEHELLNVHVVEETLLINLEVFKIKQSMYVGDNVFEIENKLTFNQEEPIKINQRIADLTKKEEIGFPCLVSKDFVNNWLTDYNYDCLNEEILQNPYSIIEKIIKAGESWSEQYLLVFVNFGNNAVYIIDEEALGRTDELTKKCFIPLPRCIEFEYINARICNDTYDLEKLSTYLRSNPEKFEIKFMQNGSLYDCDRVTGIGYIPHYNASETRNKAIHFLMKPTKEEFIDFTDNYHSRRNEYAEYYFKEFLIKNQLND